MGASPNFDTGVHEVVVVQVEKVSGMLSQKRVMF